MSEEFKNTFYGRMFEVYNADGVDFHPIGQKAPDLTVHCSYTRYDFENRNIAVPRSGYTFWKNINGKKCYISIENIETNIVVDPNAYLKMKLRECPFCGGEAILIRHSSNKIGSADVEAKVVCDDCNAHVFLTINELESYKRTYGFKSGFYEDNELFYDGMHAALIDKWNGRVNEN